MNDRLHNEQSVLLPIITAVESALKSKKANMGWQKPVILAIDGCCGSGKTYYSQILSNRYNASCIHCDDFFLPQDLRTNERLAEIGGNVHYERLRDVLHKVQQSKAFTYQAYNCSTDTFVDRSFNPTDVVIVEGSYALHPTLKQFYDVKVVFTVDAEMQRKRLLNREGANGIDNFINKWIPLENRYFEKLDISDCLIIKT